MGKRLIIKGADFSANAIGVIPQNPTPNPPTPTEIWFSDRVVPNYNYQQVVAFLTSSKNWTFNDAYNQSLVGKKITKVRFFAASYTSFNLYVTDSLESIGTKVATIDNISQAAYNEVTLNEPIILSEGQYLVFDDGAYVVQPGADDFYKRVGYSDYQLLQLGDTHILIDFGGVSYI